VPGPNKTTAKLVILLSLLFLFFPSIVISNNLEEDDWTTPSSATQSAQQVIDAGGSVQATLPEGTTVQIAGSSVELSGNVQIINGKITYASYLKVRDVELWGARDVEITAAGIAAASIDKVIVKNSFVAYDVIDFSYDFKNTISMSSASLVTVREYRFPNVRDATFVLYDDGSLRSVEMKASAKTDYILPNPFWAGWSTNKAGRAEQNSVYVDIDEGE